jgi:hypothetical protein
VRSYLTLKRRYKYLPLCYEWLWYCFSISKTSFPKKRFYEFPKIVSVTQICWSITQPQGKTPCIVKLSTYVEQNIVSEEIISINVGLPSQSSHVYENHTDHHYHHNEWSYPVGRIRQSLISSVRRPINLMFLLFSAVTVVIHQNSTFQQATTPSPMCFSSHRS